MTSHRPKCSAGTTPRISYRENARLLPQFFALAERAAMPIYCFSFSCSPSVYRRKVEPWQAEPQQSQATQSQTDERRFVPIYTTAGPRGRQQPTPESFYYSAEKRLNITRRRMLDALLGSGCLKYYLSAKAQRIVRQRMPKVLLIGESKKYFTCRRSALRSRASPQAWNTYRDQSGRSWSAARTAVRAALRR